MGYGIVICSVCSREVHQDGDREVRRGWIHCTDRTPICEEGEAIYPESVDDIKGPWCGRDAGHTARMLMGKPTGYDPKLVAQAISEDAKTFAGKTEAGKDKAANPMREWTDGHMATVAKLAKAISKDPLEYLGACRLHFLEDKHPWGRPLKYLNGVPVFDPKQEHTGYYRVDGKGSWPITRLKSSRQTGNNDPCPCGSGKKFKRCCKGKQS